MSLHRAAGLMNRGVLDDRHHARGHHLADLALVHVLSRAHWLGHHFNNGRHGLIIEAAVEYGIGARCWS
jgi:hypothetical protein